MFYNNEATSQQTQSTLWDAMRPLVCTYPFRSFREEEYPASYLAVIPPPDTDSKIRDIVDTIDLWWTNSKAEACSELTNPCPYNIEEDEQLA